MQNEISTEQTIAEMLSRWPQLIPVFLQHHMTCVGCSMAPFESLSDAMKIYGLETQAFLDELRQAMESSHA